MERLQIRKEHLCPIDCDINYYYLSDSERKKLIDKICRQIGVAKNVKLVSFCFRDLFTLVDVAKKIPQSTITHLILHDEDNKYVCQSLVDKLLLKVGGKRKFSNKSQLKFNNRLIQQLVDAGGIVAEKMTTKIVFGKQGINIAEDSIVPPPMCDFQDEPPKAENNKKIIWLGRVVDFKLPALCAMLYFVCKHRDYSMTLIGDGDVEYLKNYVRTNNLDDNNVNYVGQVAYDKIGEVIQQHAIGYACGTSIVEIGKYGLPVITALAQPTHKLFKRPICGGLYNNKYKGNEGNNLFIGETEDEQPLIEDVVMEIESNFESASRKSYLAMKRDFDFNTNVNGYLNIINSAKPLHYNKINIPKSSWLRRFFYYKIIK